MNLVPCRWSNSGWKYHKTPERQRYFNNPNRMNTHGLHDWDKMDENKSRHSRLDRLNRKVASIGGNFSAVIDYDSDYKSSYTR